MLLSILPIVLAMNGQAAAPRQAQASPAVQRPATARKIYNETADARTQIAAALKVVAEDDIRVLINWGANDDERCAQFAQAQRAPEIAGPRLLSDEYRVVSVNVGHMDRNQDVAQGYGVKLAQDALPALTVLDRNGMVVAQASAKDLLSDSDPASFDTRKIASFLAKNQAPPPPDASGPFNAAVSQAKREGKDVFVWFSAPW